MRDCHNCGYPVEQQLRENVRYTTSSPTTVSTSVCQSCGAIIDPPVVVTVNEGSGGSKDFRKLLD